MKKTSIFTSFWGKPKYTLKCLKWFDSAIHANFLVRESVLTYHMFKTKMTFIPPPLPALSLSLLSLLPLSLILPKEAFKASVKTLTPISILNINPSPSPSNPLLPSISKPSQVLPLDFDNKKTMSLSSLQQFYFATSKVHFLLILPPFTFNRNYIEFWGWN